MEYAHQHGIIHRDIKPSNVILLHDQKTIKITDFGIAHLEEADVTQHTELGEVLGTPQYMSPEQVLGKPADARSDLFSTGVVLYQLLTGQKPFQADTLATLLFQIATENPEPIHQLAPHLPSALKQTIDKLLKKKPERRFQSGKELKHALQRILNDLNESHLGEKSPSKTSIKFKWSAIMALVVATTLGLCGSYFYHSQQNTMEQQIFAYGSAMTKFIAHESAETVLSEDWTSIELFVQDNIKNQNLQYLKVLDHTGIVRGSNISDEQGNIYQSKGHIISQNFFTDVSIQHVNINTQDILNFTVPIIFQNTEIGRIHLGLSKQTLNELSEKTLWGLILVIFTTILAVFVAAFFLTRQIVLPLNVINKAINEISAKHYAYRIGIDRKDEFGALYKNFDKMASKIQKRDEKNAS